MLLYLNLTSADDVCREAAKKAFEERNARSFVRCAYPTGGTLAIVRDNVAALQAAGMYEEALIEGFVGCKTNHSHWSLREIESMFRVGDRDRLTAIGEPLPHGGPFTLYRGVGRKGRKRQITGLSWTSDFDVACKFALAGGHDPAVYEAIVPASDVFCYVIERMESEFICRPRRPRRLKVAIREMEAAAERYHARKRAASKRKGKC